jgi:Family of unknown function (DUF6489)
MKISVECTPAEARQLFGLPDLQPVQASVMAQVEKRILREVERFSPEDMLQKWLSPPPDSAEWFKSVLGTFWGLGKSDSKT